MSGAGILRIRSLLLTLILLPGVTGAGLYVAPPAWRHWQLHLAADDPVALSALRLDEALTQARLSAEVEAAIAARDAGLVESFVALSHERGLAISSDQHARITALKDGAVMRAVSDFGQGFLAGERESEAGFAGALAGDVIGFGDLRDLAVEGRKWLGGEAADPTVLAFAAAGLALSAATWISLGGALPARNGVSLLKGASRAKLLSPALTASLGRVALDAVDRPALAAGLAAFPPTALADGLIADASDYTGLWPWLLCPLGAAFGARLWARERRAGSIVLLLSQPTPLWVIAAAKFAAAWLLVVCSLLL
ncbi:MAG: hypothetical protein K2Z25_18460, partial [Beijerinckiaceae bacterium]|nr:hypothetical protein [Beijerinckiaceae bacterium]